MVIYSLLQSKTCSFEEHGCNPVRSHASCYHKRTLGTKICCKNVYLLLIFPHIPLFSAKNTKKNSCKITSRYLLFRVIPSLTYYDILSGIHSAFFLAFYLTYVGKFYLAFYLTYSDILWHSIWHMFWHFIWHYFWHSIWHKTWHSTGHFIWHIFWHSLWHRVWHSLCHVFGSRPSPLAHCIRSWWYAVRVQTWPTASDAGRKTGVVRRGAREKESRRKERGNCTFVRPSPGRWGIKVDLVTFNSKITDGLQIRHTTPANLRILQFSYFFFECSTFIMQVRVRSDFKNLPKNPLVL